MSLKQIVLRLARNEDFPDGDDQQGYVLVAPLSADGMIDLEGWRAQRELCEVRRFHPDPDEAADGLLTHNGSHWRFHYDEDHEGPDEGGYRLGDHPFRPGEYVTIASHGEKPLVYVITEVTPFHPH
ncbi:MAG: hypothetical protein HRT81_12315 [Henriciella sp.]|nr:hypothetical protein [Henriciella sp.]